MRRIKKNQKFIIRKDLATGLYRIRALKDIKILAGLTIEAGTYGGLVSHKEVLSERLRIGRASCRERV